MSQVATQTETVDRLVGMRLRQLQRATGLPAVFGGATTAAAEGRQLRIGHVRGTLSRSLLDLRVNAGRGLGGSAILTGELRTVRDYASTQTITHDFDGIVVQQEQISSIFALPLMLDGVVRGIVYGAVRGPHRIGDAVLERAATFGASLERELVTSLTPPSLQPTAAPRTTRRVHAALDELDELARNTSDAGLRKRLLRIAVDLREIAEGESSPAMAIRNSVLASAETTSLAPREIEVLRLIATGMSNSEAAGVMRLSTETVRAYLRSGMRRLDVHNRTAAVHAARQAGLI